MEAMRDSATRVVGTKQVLRGLKEGTIARVIVAEDADTFLFQRIIRAADAARIPVERVPSMRDLGRACGVETSAATVGVLR